MQRTIGEFNKLSTAIVAVSADGPEFARQAAIQGGLSFPVLADPRLEAINLYGVRHPNEGIARPAVFIIDTRGIIRYVHVGQDAADRPDVSMLINALKWL